MKRILLPFAILLSLLTGAQAQVSKASMTTQIGTCFPDNTSQLITPAILRTCLTAMVNSYQQFGAVNAQVGTSYTVALTDYGQLLTFNNASAIAVTLPQATGSFITFNFYACNLGTGSLTITPTTSTIGGSASLSLTTNACAQIISDGVNYQTLLYGGSGGGPQVYTNTSTVQSTNYTFASSDCGTTVYVLGGNFFTVTVPTITGFPAACVITLVNRGNFAALGRAKIIANDPGCTSTIQGVSLLYPGQRCTIGIQGGNWRAIAASTQKARIQGNNTGTNTVTWFVDGTNGSNTAADGLASGAGAFATCQYAIDRISMDVDAAQQNIVIQVNDGTQCTAGMVLKTVVGIYDFWPNSTLLIQGNVGTPVAINCGSNNCITGVNVSGWRIQGFAFTSTAGIVNCDAGSHIYIGTNTIAGGASAGYVPFTASYTGFLEFVAGATITNNDTLESAFINATFAARVIFAGSDVIAMTNSINYGTGGNGFMLLQDQSFMNFNSALTFTGAGATGSTGPAFRIAANSVLNYGHCANFGSQVNPAYLPGNSAGTSSTGALCE